MLHSQSKVFVTQHPLVTQVTPLFLPEDQAIPNDPLLSNDQLPDAWAMPVAAPPAMQHTARKIAVRSLR